VGLPGGRGDRADRVGDADYRPDPPARLPEPGPGGTLSGPPTGTPAPGPGHGGR
jgi:hypothetical protein